MKMALSMKHRFPGMTGPVLLIIFFASCAEQPKQSPQNDRAAIDSLLKIQEDAYDQNNEEGRKILAATCDDSLIFVGGDDGGQVQSAQFYVHDLADGYAKRPSNRTYRIFDHTAIVTAIQQTYKVFNKDTIYFNARSTKVFVKEAGEWKMSYVSYAPLPVLYHPPFSGSSKGFEQFAGLYDNGGPAPDTVVVEGGRVFLAAAGAPRSELFPVSDYRFLGEDYFGTTGFEKDGTGQVSGMYYEYPDGQRIHFRKLNKGRL